MRVFERPVPAGEKTRAAGEGRGIGNRWDVAAGRRWQSSVA